MARADGGRTRRAAPTPLGRGGRAGHRRAAAAPQRRYRPKGQAPFGWRRDETGGLVAVPEQQAAIRQMRRMKDRSLSLREIAAAMRGAGIKISHMTVKNATGCRLERPDRRRADRGPPRVITRKQGW
jgi:hypothetical protein